MHAGVGRGVVDEHLAVRVGNPAVGKEHVHHVAHVFPAFRGHEEAAGLGNHPGRVFQGGHIQVQHIAQAAGAAPHAVGQVQPALGGFDGVRALAVLHFLNGVVEAPVDDFLLLDDGVLHAVHQGPAYSAAVARVDEAVLRAGIEGIFSVHELRMQHHVALLAGALDVRQALPVHQILGAGHAGGRRGGRQVSLRVMVFALYAEDAVNPAVLMGGEAHVVHVGGGFSPLRHGDGTGPEAEVVHTVRAFGHGKEGLAVVSFHTHHQHVFVTPLDGAGIEGGMDADPFHQIRISLLVQVIAPLQRSMLGREDGILVALVNAVSLNGGISSFNQLLMTHPQPGQTFFVSHD